MKSTTCPYISLSKRFPEAPDKINANGSKVVNFFVLKCQIRNEKQTTMNKGTQVSSSIRSDGDRLSMRLNAIPVFSA
jgi:hypothetical protein